MLERAADPWRSSAVPAGAIAVVRHGETDWNLSRRIQGRTEVPLNGTGRAQAAATGELLSSTGSWGRVISSPLGRAIETAEIIGGVLGVAHAGVDTRLIERDFGQAEGDSVPEAEARWPGLEVPGAEPLESLAERAVSAMEELVRFAPGTVAVAHGAFLRAGLSRITGTDMPRIVNGEVWLLSPGATGALEVGRLAR